MKMQRTTRTSKAAANNAQPEIAMDEGQPSTSQTNIDIPRNLGVFNEACVQVFGNSFNKEDNSVISDAASFLFKMHTHSLDGQEAKVLKASEKKRDRENAKKARKAPEAGMRVGRSLILTSRWIEYCAANVPALGSKMKAIKATGDAAMIQMMRDHNSLMRVCVRIEVWKARYVSLVALDERIQTLEDAQWFPYLSGDSYRACPGLVGGYFAKKAAAGERGKNYKKLNQTAIIPPPRFLIIGHRLQIGDQVTLRELLASIAWGLCDGVLAECWSPSKEDGSIGFVVGLPLQATGSCFLVVASHGLSAIADSRVEGTGNTNLLEECIAIQQQDGVIKRKRSGKSLYHCLKETAGAVGR
nr:TPA_asm: hypothetical protein [Tilapia lake virus]DBA09001.1 TPA_asm: hypothetical protein [Tilapia lake virus]